MEMIERTGSTPEEAIEIALKELNANRQDVEINIVSKGKPGFLGIGAEPATVRVKLIENHDDITKITSEILDNLIDKMGVSALIDLKQSESPDIGGPIFNIDGEDSSLLIGRRGETLRAIQFLVSFIASRQLGRRANVLVDVSDYQARRQKSLSSMAQRVAHQVIKNQSPITLEPMPSNERRIIHMALADNENISTVSTGEGADRQVTVHIAKQE